MEIHKKSSTRLFAQLSEQELSRYRLTFRSEERRVGKECS